MGVPESRMPGHRKPEYQLNSLPITENYDNRLIWQNVPVGKVEPMKIKGHAGMRKLTHQPYVAGMPKPPSGLTASDIGSTYINIGYTPVWEPQKPAGYRIKLEAQPP